MSAGKVLLGVLTGVAVGAMLGILFAPDKGSTTRRKIAQKSDDYADELEGKFKQFVEDVSEKFESVKEEATRMARKARNKTEEAESGAAEASR